MVRVRIPPRLLRRLSLGIGLGAVLTTVVAAQPAPPPIPPQAPTPVEPAAAPKAAVPGETPPPAAAPAPVAAPAEAKPAAPAPPKPVVPEKPAPPLPRNRYDIAVLQALDKVTAETLRFEAKVGVPVRWKGLIFTVRACERAAPDEPVDDSIVYLTIDAQPRPQPGRLTPPPKQAFKGWMYASSPALNPLQHATYDAWAISCRASAPPVVAAVAPRPAPKPAEPKLLELPPAAGSPAAAAPPAPKAAEPPPARPAAEPAPKTPPPTTP